MSKPPSEPERPKPVVIAIGADGEVTATVDGEPVDPDELLLEITAVFRDAANDADESPSS